jgi:predicted TIM-barrel fold metal-dependent hydrolase
MTLHLSEPPLVDSHAHIFTTDMQPIPTAWRVPDYSFTGEDYLSALDTHGIRYGVIAGISIYGTNNDYMIEQLRKHKRLRGTATVSADIDRETLQCMRDDGVVGIRLQLARRKELPDFFSSEYQTLFRHLADLDMHVQAVVEGARWPEVLPALESAGVKIVIDHFTHPTPSFGVDCPGLHAALKSVENGRTWIKLSAGYRLTWAPLDQPQRDPRSRIFAKEIAQALLKHAGAERLVWGSDCPFIGYESAISFQDTVNDFYEWVPDAATRRVISNTALKLYFS